MMEKSNAPPQRGCRLGRRRIPWIWIIIASCIMIAIIILAACLGALLPRHNNVAGPTVKLAYGSYKGTRLQAGVDQYLGMRFAAPPTGNNRWRAPAAAQKFSGTQNATDYQPICLGVSAPLSAGQSEDCLYLNVFTPSNATSSSRLPVWVYIQGGGYSSDASAHYNGTEVLTRSGMGIVMVTFNYRVGAFGFLASEKIRANGDLNAGLLDQRAALQWVKSYISNFGGNPDHVVIHGGSAGAGSVGQHLIAYGGRNDGLFVGAIAQSPYFPTQRNVSDLEFQYSRFVTASSCNGTSDPLACLRSRDIKTLQGANYGSPYPGHKIKPHNSFAPTVEGNMIPDYPINLFNQGRYLSVPLMVGNEPDEGSIVADNATNQADVTAFFMQNYPNLNLSDTDNINAQYPKTTPLPKHADYFPSLSAAYGQSTLICPAIWMCSALSNTNSSGVWNYSFNVTTSQNTAAGLGVPHTFDTAAIFGADYAGTPESPSDSTFVTGNYNAPIVPILMDYYISFVKTLSPNSLKNSEAPEWTSFSDGTATGSSQRRLVLTVGSTQMYDVPTPLQKNCAFWRTLNEKMEQ